MLGELFTAVDLAHTPHHSTPGGERCSFSPLRRFIIRSAFILWQIPHSRAKSQKFISVFLGSPVNLPPPCLHYPPPPSPTHSPSRSWGGEKIHDTGDVPWRSGNRVELSVNFSACMSHAAATHRTTQTPGESATELGRVCNNQKEDNLRRRQQ